MIKPCRGKYLAELLSDETIMPSGIILASTKKEKRHRAKVVAIGPPNLNKKGMPFNLVAKVGDRVHFKRDFGSQFEWEGKKMVSLKSIEIVAVEVV